MRTIVVGAVIALGVVGCGDPSPSEQLQGSWITDPDANGCVSGANFRGDHLQLVDLCTLSDGSFGFQSAEGPFVVFGGDSISLEIAEASCPREAFSMTTFGFDFAVSGDSLTLKTSSGALLMKRNTASGGTATVKFGCFDDATGNFFPMPISPL